MPENQMSHALERRGLAGEARLPRVKLQMEGSVG